MYNTTAHIDQAPENRSPN